MRKNLKVKVALQDSISLSIPAQHSPTFLLFNISMKFFNKRFFSVQHNILLLLRSGEAASIPACHHQPNYLLVIISTTTVTTNVTTINLMILLYLIVLCFLWYSYFS